MKWLLKHKTKFLIVVSSLVGLYVTWNLVINLIGVPLAAYHSYEVWQMGQNGSVEELLQEQDSFNETAKDSIVSDSLHLPNN